MLGITLWAFMPGLGGSFIFDDYPNLIPWQNLGDIDRLEDVLTFIFSGAGTPGRPLSLLSFLIDDQSWSPDIYSLKRTNLAIHLLNSCLVFWLCLSLLPYLIPTESYLRHGMFALLAATVWSLHPLQVSNVSYIIQRMNLLSTLCELCGLLIFVRGRELLETSPRKAILLCTFSISFFMPIGVLFKENGLLLCAFALLIEAFCFSTSRHAFWRLWKIIFLWFPLLAFLAYCLNEYQFFNYKHPTRDFSSWERLLTQGPVLVDYLNKLLIPRLQGSGLYFDNFPISRSLVHPVITLPCWLLLITLLTAAWHFRRKLPLFSFGIFFYFSGHLMESTLLPLELYFEHRNYLPQLGLWLALIQFLSITTRLKFHKSLALGGILLIFLLALMTRHNADLWGKPELQTAIWYHDNPSSLRTTLSYANLLLEKGDFDKLTKVLESGIRNNPDSLILRVSQRYVRCYLQNLPVTFTDLPAIAKRSKHEFASMIMLEKMRAFRSDNAVANGACTPATPIVIAQIYLALLENPNYATPNTQSHLLEYLGEIASGQGNLNEAMYYYERAFQYSNNPIYPYRQAVLLQSAGLHEQAQAFTAISWHALNFRYRVLYPVLESRLRSLEAELKKAQRANP